AGTGGALEDVDLVLPRAPLHRIDMVYEAVGKEPVGKERAIRFVDQEILTIVIHIMDRFSVIEVLVTPHTDVGAYHVMKSLEYVAHDRIRAHGQDIQKFIEGDGLTMLPFTDFAI